MRSFVILSALVAVASCGEDPAAQPCDSLSCGEHGTCVEEDGQPQCACFAGYVSLGQECVAQGSDGDADSDTDVDADTDGDSDTDAANDGALDAQEDGDDASPDATADADAGPDLCLEAERNGEPCRFCTDDGRQRVRCAFCYEDDDLEDLYEQCEPGDVCLELSCTEGEFVSCVDADAELCEPDAPTQSCIGTMSQNCDHCIASNFDCATIGEECMVTTHSSGLTSARCVHPGATVCDPDHFVESCDEEENAAIYCSISEGVTGWDPCGEGLCVANDTDATCLAPDAVRCEVDTPPRCDDGQVVSCEPIFHSDPEFGGYEVAESCHEGRECQITAIGGLCVQQGTSACDAETYEPHCDGDLAMTCWESPGWETSYDCGYGGFICDMFHGQPSCAPEGYTFCDVRSYEAGCDGNTARHCQWPGYLHVEVCEYPNPECHRWGRCTIEGGQQCPLKVVPPLCLDDVSIVYCESANLPRAEDCRTYGQGCVCGRVDGENWASCVRAAPGDRWVECTED